MIPQDHMHGPGALLGRLARQIVLPKSWDCQVPTGPLDGYRGAGGTRREAGG